MTPEDVRSIAETLKIISDLTSSKPNEWLPVYAALGGAVAGALASFFPSWFMETRKETAFAKQIEACLLAEMSALLEVIESRQYVSSIRNIISELKCSPEGSVRSFIVDVPPHYSRVYQENCKNIGVVRIKTARKIIIFHQLLDAVVQDMKPEGVFSKGAALKHFAEMDSILSQAMHIARELTDEPPKTQKP